jgi:hypothetical protein
MADYSIRQDRLRKLSQAIIDSTKTPKSLLKRIRGLEELEIEFKKFYRESDYNNEDHAISAFIEKSFSKRVTVKKSGDLRVRKISTARFINFALFFLDNLQGVKLSRDEDLNLIGLDPLTFDDLWRALNIFGRVKIKVKMLMMAKNMPVDLWKRAKRKEGYKRPIGKFVYSELLGLKSWDTSVEKKLIEHKEFFKSLAIGYFSGHSKYGIEIEEFLSSSPKGSVSKLQKKSSDMLVFNGLREYMSFRSSDCRVPSCIVDLSLPDEPKFSGISLPISVLRRLKEDQKGEKEDKKFLENIVIRPPVRNT